MVPIVSVVGKSNSGKTTLIEKLIPILKEKGYKVGAIKHDAHKFDIDHEGKDTWRMARSGANTVVITSMEKIAMIKNIDCEKNLNEIAQWLFTDVDIIITEGYKSMDKPKIEVIRFDNPITSADNNLIALVDNFADEKSFELPEGFDNIKLFRFKDIEKIADFIIQKFLCKDSSKR
ncbi:MULTISPECIES: molybdopterin-guanine dinucleotide biosynthesis protein B [Acetivibrio]|jgi:molybdopterin-guanine dinucleotide biosynthesis protein B|uniref:molybdopterin-guanine dinucleotide biosynthesis protein B n=1 Tax=Acetivibrio TaxID=35829 RepID=UPI0022403E1E|nr:MULTISPECIES: molybdopterin-guanine dinucleotide biosynthesis protein B [Acetivibrio]HOM02679.1 molybdopterin-guanine dinucleotide biosynthesis protein B [Acetivibrio sp.]HOV25721.1 molybdopterin-guanine dinucleotide biosynthesis protein B [Pseudobacteroides sp.]